MNVIFLTDGYKLDHRRQYPKGTEFIQANWTPRSCSNYKEAEDGVVVFGIHYVLKRITELFQDFFEAEESSTEYMDFVNRYLGYNEVGGEHIKELHEYGKLPLLFKHLPEGELCPIGVPMLTVENTDPKFFWLVNYIETLLSNMLWLPMTSATTARLYKKNLKEHSDKVGIELNPFLCHDFSMRGMAGIDSTILSGMGHLTSFTGSESIPAIIEIEKYYHTNKDTLIASTVPATEHSVMCAGTKENEINTYKRLITEVYPKGYISIVSDTWDLWKVLTEYTVELKEEILARDGRVVFRPDSGNPVDIICGIDTSKFRDFDAGIDETYSDEDVKNIASYGFIGNVGEIIKMSNKYWTITKVNSNDTIMEVEQLPEHIIKGAYEILWDIFGGHINEKGYKVLNDKVGLIYGDAITLERQKEIYKRLEEKSFSASNLVLGIGSFTYQYKTRDSLGFAMKSTWCQVNGVSQPIFKNPITDNGTKKSAIGKVDVIKVNGVYKLKDDANYSTGDYKSELVEFNPNNLVQLKDIRDRIDKGL